MHISELLHKRILVAEKEHGYGTSKIVKEIKILEVSPSGNWVKVMNDHGNKYWVHYSAITPIEVLAAINKDKPA